MSKIALSELRASSHDGDGLFCLTALIWRCLGVGAWVWHDGYVQVFRVVFFLNLLFFRAGRPPSLWGLCERGSAVRGASLTHQCRPLITYLYPEAAVAAKIDKWVNG